jgi:hypothetical protein
MVNTRCKVVSRSSLPLPARVKVRRGRVEVIIYWEFDLDPPTRRQLMETSPFAALARLKVLIIPVGDIPRTKFEEWATVVRGFESIPLFDIPPAMGEDKGESDGLIRSDLYSSLGHRSPIYAATTVHWLSAPALCLASATCMAPLNISLQTIRIPIRCRRDIPLY